ncbi:fimbrial protein [Trinickia soli]|uniref:Fimbrial protein n=1 Tax=Trinickia soli TaxID=380675 RepID=A0A2N7W3S2_9BURK|nr:fimbrial protein [Trinickia soli]KAA0089451.1 fimbrial protein [Paraburkholderia sp. T12-10]PMS24033.1 fimbrial protein [Trinickia soli]
MNARAPSLSERERAIADYFVFASCDEAHVRWLAHALTATGVVEPAAHEPVALSQRIAALRPSLVFVDFSGGAIDTATRAVQAARALLPQISIVAVGNLAEPAGAIAALRAGVRDFIDLAAGAQEAARITRGVLENMTQVPARHGRITVLLGARVGVGVSTLAAHLSVLLQKRGVGDGRQAALVDLGLPAGDGMLYLDTRSEFDFVEAVRNLHRFDETFVHTALARHASGLALTTLPPDLSALRTVSHASAVALLTRLRAFFDQQIVDLGGFSNHEFIAQIAQAADEIWLVCDPAIASIVSAVDLLRELAAAQLDAGRIGVVVNKYDARLGLTAEQIAARLGLPLVATLPARRVALMQAANLGRLLVDTAGRDPYVRSLDTLLERIGPPEASGASVRPDSGNVARHLARFKRFIHLPPKRS